ncbi:MAG: glutathione S-transferase family protein [Mastigocoleus sp.]
MKLYYIATTRAVRPRWLLEEMGIPYELVRVTPEMSKKAEYQKLHPQLKVPVLVDESVDPVVTIFESAAICTYLTDKYPELEFAPPQNSPQRAYYYQWLFYATNTLEKPVEHFLFAALPKLPEKTIPEKVRFAISTQESLEWFNTVAEPLRNSLQNQDYLVGNRFTTADIVTGGVLLWAERLKMLNDSDVLSRYLSNLMERPGFKTADEDFYAAIPPQG